LVKVRSKSGDMCSINNALICSSLQYSIISQRLCDDLDLDYTVMLDEKGRPKKRPLYTVDGVHSSNPATEIPVGYIHIWLPDDGGSLFRPIGDAAQIPVFLHAAWDYGLYLGLTALTECKAALWIGGRAGNQNGSPDPDARLFFADDVSYDESGPLITVRL
jgi:hypothetical protein